MGTVYADVMIGRAARELKDPGFQRWSLEQMTQWLNDAQREICLLKPEAYVRTVSFECVAGTQQTLPDDGEQLIDVTRNMGSGSTPGAAIRIVERENLDALRPNWQASTGASVVSNFVYDRRVPRSFYLYPGPAAAVRVQLQYSAVPPDAAVESINGASASSVLSISDIYQTAINDYLLMRALGKDTDARDGQRSGEAYQRFLNRLGLRLQIEKAHDANRNSPPRDDKRDGGGRNADEPF